MATLFEIGADLLALDALLDEIGGDVSDPQVEAAVATWMQELATDEAAKLDRMVGYAKQMDMEATAAKAEAEQWQAKAKSRESRAAWVRGLVKAHLEGTGRTKAVTATGLAITIQANGGSLPLDIDDVDPATLDAAFTETRVVVNRRAVVEALAAGSPLPFARFKPRGTHLRVR